MRTVRKIKSCVNSVFGQSRAGVIVAIGLGFSIFGSSHAAFAQQTIKFGVPASLSGGASGFGIPQACAMKVVAQQINEEGGIPSLGGAKIELIVSDDQSSPQRDTQLLQEMASQGVSAFLGPFTSSATIANIPTFNRIRIPMLQSNFDDRVTSSGSRYVFRVVSNAGGWTEAATAFLNDVSRKRNTPIKTIGLLTTNVPPGTSLHDGLVKGAKENNWATVDVSYDRATTLDFSPIVSQFAKANVDIIVGYQDPNDSVLFAQAFLQQSWRPRLGLLFIGGGQQTINFMKTVGSGVEGWLDIIASGGAPDGAYGPKAKALAARFEKECNDVLIGVQATGATQVVILAEAVNRAASREPEKVRDALAALDFGDGGATWPYILQAGGYKTGANNINDNVRFQPLVVQLKPPGTQTVVWPEKYASQPLKWPLYP